MSIDLPLLLWIWIGLMAILGIMAFAYVMNIIINIMLKGDDEGEEK